MNEWLLLIGVKGLKAAIVGSLSVLSFGVDVLSSVADLVRPDEDRIVVVVVREAEPVATQALAWVGGGLDAQFACAESPDTESADVASSCTESSCTESPLDRFVHRKIRSADRPDVLVQLGALVPPILVEALFPPDLLLPPLLKPVPAPQQAVKLAPAPPAKRPT